jgi:periplasmic protein TonB
MSTTTVNAFPPFHSFNSSRSWFMAFIVLLHVGFFWGLTHGVTIGSVKLAPPVIVVDVPTKPQPPKPLKPRDPVIERPWTPVVEQPVLRNEDESTALTDTTHERPPPRREVIVEEKPGSGPLITEPELDARYPFTEPDYPVSEIRQGHEGTVLLALQILPNGRVGEVRIERSSGYEKLDASAAREARKWRMKPGTSGGTALAMWKKVPIKFQLKN